MEESSLVEYLYEEGGIRPYKCGYCKSQDKSYTQGVWGFKMTCQDYQSLVDRGFQRSGNFVYRPMMKTTCCPQYVIRMDAAKFKLSKSQKSSIKKFKRYLVEGKKSGEESVAQVDSKMDDMPSSSAEGALLDINQLPDHLNESSMKASKPKKVVKPGVGPDPNKPPCKKAKVIRKEMRAQKKLAKKQERAVSQDSSKPSPSSISTSQNHASCNSKQEVAKICQNLKDFLALPKDNECIHKFKTRLVRVEGFCDDFSDTYNESYQVFKKFQMTIHQETEEDSGEKQFNEFLVNSPLIYEEAGNGIEYGTYHQQYILDEKIFAVGVLDILPKGVLCEYLYYDPDYRFIAPGVITALQEISLTQELYQQNPEMQYYYMGFYVQSCPKMNYKSRYDSSALLCPETYTYISLEQCIPRLKASPYCRLASPDVKNPHEGCTPAEMDSIPVWADATEMQYHTYRTLNGDHAKQSMEEYVELVGLEVAYRMKIYLSKM